MRISKKEFCEELENYKEDYIDITDKNNKVDGIIEEINYKNGKKEEEYLNIKIKQENMITNIELKDFCSFEDINKKENEIYVKYEVGKIIINIKKGE